VIKKLLPIIGGISDTSKMPCLSYNLDAKLCNVGGKLSTVKGSVCEDCYAKKGFYTFPVVKGAMENKRKALQSIRQWTEAFVELLTKSKAKDDRYFRWHDSGDLQSARHLKAIIEIAERVPQRKFWLPTREYDLVRGITFPENLIVRVSYPMVGQAYRLSDWSHTSSVGAHEGFHCPAYTQGGKCVTCRECWNPDVVNVDYTLH